MSRATHSPAKTGTSLPGRADLLVLALGVWRYGVFWLVRQGRFQRVGTPQPLSDAPTGGRPGNRPEPPPPVPGRDRPFPRSHLRQAWLRCAILVLGGLSSGCSQVYVSNGLPEGDQADIPGLEGRWSSTEDPETGERFSFEVVREGRGDYRIIPVASGEDLLADPETGEFIIPESDPVRVRVRVTSFLVDDQAFLEVKLDSSADFPRPFPILLKADFTSDRLRLWTLKTDFLKHNPAVVPHVTLGNAGAAENAEFQFPDYLITASPERLAAFLELVHDNPAAWNEISSESQPVVRETTPPGLAARAGTRLWGVMVKLFWIGVIGCGISIAVGFLHQAYQRLIRGTSPAESLRQAWVEEVVRLLILAVRMTREDQALRDQERSLIRSVAVAEAKRSDAPGDPIPLTPAEMDTLIRGYERECPGVPDLIGILANPDEAVARTRLLKRIWQVAVCDGPATDREVAFAEGYAADTGLSEAEFLAIARRYYRPGPPAATLVEARRLLEVLPSATVEDVKRAYKRKAREYHPDAHAGVSDNLKRLTAERFSQLGEAKELLLAALGAVPLVGRDRAGRLVPAEDLPNEICCFGCGAVRPGVPAGLAFQARCPKCLALLFHEPDFAVELSRDARGPTAAEGSR